MSLNPEGPLGTCLCGITLTALLTRSQQRIFLQVKKICFFFSFSPVNFLNPCLSCVPLSFLPQYILFLCVNRFSIWYYWSLVLVMGFRDFSWRSFLAIVDILKCGWIITWIVFHVLHVPGCRPVLCVVLGLKVHGFLPISEEHTPAESQWWLGRDTTSRRNRLSFLICQMTILWMGTPPHRVILPGVGPILVASLWVI